MQNFKIKFIIEQEWEGEIQANSAEEAYEMFYRGEVDSRPTEWTELQSDSVEIEEVTDGN